MLSQASRRVALNLVAKRGMSTHTPQEKVRSLFYPNQSQARVKSEVTFWRAKLDKYEHDHAHPHHNVMSRESELPVGDWRRKPMNFNFEKAPSTDYERWIIANTNPSDKYFSHLTKGEFIVHMRRLYLEQRGCQMYWERFLAMAIVTVAGVNASYTFWTPDDPTETTLAERQYLNVLKPSPLIGAASLEHKHHQERLAEFFADHDEEDIAKLPQQLQDVYHKYKEEYNAAL